MAESNGEWGKLAEHDDELAEVWDGFSPLPDPGENEALDAFVESKNITIDSLVRFGARLSEHTVLAFAYPGGLKFRDMVTGRRWAYAGSTWPELKIIRQGQEPSDKVIVCEGETDAARLSLHYPVDVAALPAGAGYFPSAYADQLSQYEMVLVGLDNDHAGDGGADRIIEALPTAMRFRPTANDWCASEELPPLPDALERPPEMQLLVPAGAMLEMEVPEVASWFEQELLPIGGLILLHGGYKSFKTFMTLDMMAALAQGLDWACFEPTEEPTKVGIVQFELPWAYYRQRIHMLHQSARERELFEQNFLTLTPMRRPQLVAGNKKQEDFILKSLLDAGVQVVLFDPIRRLAGAIDMNAEQDVRKVLAFFQRVNDEGITVVATHHDNKTSMRARGGDPLGMTGSGAWGGDPDTVISVELPQGDDFRTSQRRNLQFMLRNAPAPGPRGFQIDDDGRILYSPEPHGEGIDDGDEQDTPAI